MKSPYVGSLVPNDVVTAQFLVLSKEIRQKKTGEPYLTLHLSDRTGEIEAKMWDNVAEVMHTFERDDFVKVKGLVQIYQNRSQFTVHRLRRMEEHEVDLSDYFPCSERDPEEMFAELRSIIRALANPHLRSLLELVFSDEKLAALYKIAPAAKHIHHACRGGLLEHVLSLCEMCRLSASHYKEIDCDLLIGGAILHDIGKIEELSYERSFSYTADGQLLGHIIIGLRIVGTRIDQLPDFPARLRTLLEHMMISHHGELEFGSPKVPVFPEALLLHHLDNLDSKMDAMRSAVKRDSHIDGEFTGWISSLERILLKKDRFLNGASPARDASPDVSSIPAAASTESASPPEGSTPPPAREMPGPPVPPAADDNRPIPQVHKPPPKPTPTTLFGEKLQAVLEPRK